MESIHLIQENHGKTCETWKLAAKYKQEWATLVCKYSDGVYTDKVAEGNEADFDEEADELEKSYLKELCAEYLKILKDECEHLETDEQLKETFEANGYEFTADGKIYK